MARPITTRVSRRAQVGIGQTGGGLGVYAPINVQTPGAAADPLAGLGQALGLFGGIAAERAKVQKEADFAQGQADESVKKTDLERAKRSQAYADGAYEVSMLRIYTDAQEKVTQRAATELDNSKTLDEKTAIIDGWMREELGPFVDDPAARRIIGSRYTQFLEHTAGNMLAEEVQAREQAALDTVTTDTLQRLSVGAKVAYEDIYGPLYRILGDKSKANEQAVALVAQMKVEYAKRGEDWKALDALIPAEIVTEDGQKLPGPRFTPKLRDILDRSDEAAQRAYDDFVKPKVAAEGYTKLSSLDTLIGSEEITDQTFARMGITVGDGPQYHMSFDQARAYKRQSVDALMAKRAMEDEQDTWESLAARTGRWRDIIAHPEGGPKNAAEAERGFTLQTQRTLIGLGIPTNGAEFLANPQAVETVVNLSAQNDMAYTPLKETMSGINAAAPGDVEARVGVYRMLKAKGIASLYVDEEAEAMYETALLAVDAGQKGDALTKHIRESGDRATTQAVSDAMSPKNYRVRSEGFEIQVPGRFFGTNDFNSRDTLNGAYLAMTHERLTRFYLSKSLPADKAQERATERIMETHIPIPIGDSYAVLPKDDVPDPKAVTEAFEWMDSTLPARAKELGLPDGAELTIRPAVGINGRRTEFRLMDRGVEVPGGRTFTIEGLLKAYYLVHPDKAPGVAGRKAANAQSEAAQKGRDELIKKRNSPIPSGSRGIMY